MNTKNKKIQEYTQEAIRILYQTSQYQHTTLQYTNQQDIQKHLKKHKKYKNNTIPPLDKTYINIKTEDKLKKKIKEKQETQHTPPYK